MRDGVRLATDIYLPQGKGSWPVVLVRTPYNRREPRQSDKSVNYLQNGYVFVIQDLRGLFESERRFPPGATVGTMDPEDGYDTVEWISRQPWCTGKVGITGGSGPGFAAKQTIVSNPPHLVAAVVSVSGMFPRDFVFYHGGVPMGWSDGWVANRGIKVASWPRPRPLQLVTNVGSGPGPLIFGPWPPDHKELAPAGRIAILDNAGWFDFFTEASLDDFMALRGRNNRLIMGARAHGVKLAGSLKYPPQFLGDTAGMAWFDYWLKGKDTGVMNSPPIRYFLMGDTTRPGAPGNVWKQAERWPIPNTPASYYLFPDSRLRTTPPSQKQGSLSYAYDPRDPTPNYTDAYGLGPHDERLFKDRKDVLRFTTEPLKEPLEVTGKVLAELYLAADVQDTTIIAKLIDIYPNGYEAVMLRNSMMTRYRNGFNKPAPLEKGKLAKVTVDLWSTALVFDKGHRIGLYITNSAPYFEVHPNTYEPVPSFDQSPVAHMSVETSAAHPSRLILPIIAPGVSKDYTPKKAYIPERTKR